MTRYRFARSSFTLLSFALVVLQTGTTFAQQRPSATTIGTGKSVAVPGALARSAWIAGAPAAKPLERTPGVSRAGLATPQVDGTYTVYRGKAQPIVGYTVYNNTTCAHIGGGSYTVTAPPSYGSISYGVLTLPVSGGPCSGRSYPFTVAFYTWTDGSPPAGTGDTFALRFTRSDNGETEDSSWGVMLADPQADANATGPADTIGSDCAFGCATWSVAPLAVSLTLKDVPLAYRPPRGPPINFALHYAHRDVQQPATFNYGNFGPQWTSVWHSYVTDAIVGQSTATLYQRGGGAETYRFASSTATISQPAPYSQAILARTVNSGGATTGFTRQMKDGSSEVFARAASGNRFFMTAVIDPHGNRVTLTYDAQVRLTQLTDAVGRNTVLAYAASDPLKVTSVTDPFGRIARFTYVSGRLSSITDALGLASEFTYGPGNFINTLRTPYGITRFSFTDASTNPALGNTRTLTITDPVGQVSRVEFNERVAGVPATAPSVPPGMAAANAQLDQRNTYIWDPVQYAAATVGGGLDYTRAQVIHWLRSSSGATVSRVRASIKQPLEDRVWLDYAGQDDPFTEGPDNKPLNVARVHSDGGVQTQGFTYNVLGKPLSAIDPVGRRTVFTYDASGTDLLKVEQQTSAGGVLSQIAGFAYNAQHLPLSATDAATQATGFTYNAAGQVLSVTNALNETTTLTYDILGRLTQITNANGVVQETRTYDALDRVATATDSEGHTLHYAYDVMDRVTEITYPDDTKTTYTYDKLELASVTDRQGRKTGYTYDANRRLTVVTDALGQTTRYGYHANGALASITDAKGNLTRWDIDIQGRPIARHYANGNVETYAYDAASSRIASITDPLGQTKSFGYTRDDRISALTYSNTVLPTASVAFTFDAFFPRLVSMTDGIGTTAFHYHAPGTAGALKLAADDGPYVNDTVAYTYDALGRVATRTVDTAIETFVYDRLSRTTGHTSELGSFTRAYLGQTGQLTSQIATTGVGTTWSYEPNVNDRRLRGIAHTGQTRSFGFTTTPEGQISAIAESVAGVAQRNWTYGYDDLDRLTSATPSTGPPYGYAYDASDNLTSNNGLAITHNAANQVTAAGGTAFVYDAAGNLLDDGIRTYQWDAESRLIRIDYKAQAGNATVLRYDGLGRRLAVADTTPVGTSETRHLWCGETLCQARNAADQVTRRYFAEGVVVPQSGQQLYYGTDQIGSVRDLLAMQNGSKVASFDYDPYGQPTASNGRVSTEFRYAQLYYHGQSGLYLANYRAYNPRTAQWLSRDPIEEWDGPNLYGYVAGRVTLAIDPMGLAIGDSPPKPPGYDPKTWKAGELPRSNKPPVTFLEDPDGTKYLEHREDRKHWRHWDVKDRNFRDLGRCPKNSIKPWPTQQAPPYGDQSAKDPSGNARPWNAQSWTQRILRIVPKFIERVPIFIIDPCTIMPDLCNIDGPA